MVMRVLVLSLLVLALAWYFFFVYVPPGTIILRNDGFHPRVITIKAGETVTFKTARTKYFWPASDFHPSHTLYSDFDPKVPVGPSESWTFTFTEAGTYPFHDHLAAFYSGMIRVQAVDGTVPDNCMERGGQLRCWQNALFLSLAQKGVDAAFDSLTALYGATPSFAASCHYLTHNLGLASYQFYKKDPSSVLSEKAVACAAGFYHGFMEGFLGATGDVEKAGAVCDRIGDKLGDKSPDARLQCYHGIGHGAVETAVVSAGAVNRPEDIVNESIRMCEAASFGRDERYRCVSGAYNGVANFFISDQYGFSFDSSDPRVLCASQKDEYKEACYGELNSIAKIFAKGDFQKAAAYMLSIPDKDYRHEAIQYIGVIYALDHVADTSFEGVVRGCHALPSEYRGDCLSGFRRGLFEHGAPGAEYQQGFALCAEHSLTDAEQENCYKEGLSTLHGWYNKEKSAHICTTVPERYQKYCPL